MANLITLARIALVVPFIVFFLANAAWNMKAAFVIFVIAAASDFLDGYVARKRGETSRLGAALDPLADKLLIAAALLLLIRNGVVHGAGVLAALVIILREILVSGLREAVAQSRASLKVTSLAKWKTTFQMIAVGLLLLSAPGGFATEAIRPWAAGALWFAAILTAWTGAQYAIKAYSQLKEPAASGVENG